jgi:hypothetical protein
MTENGNIPNPSTPMVAYIATHNNPCITHAPALVQPDPYGNVFINVMKCGPLEHSFERNDFIGYVENTVYLELRELYPNYINSINYKHPHPKPTTLVPEKCQFIENTLKDKVPEKYYDQYLKILIDNHDVVSRNKFDLGRSSTLLHEIALKTKEPIYVKQFKIPDAHRIEVEKHVADWLKLGVIQPTRSKYNSPIFVVAKKNGGLRLVQDFRALNEQTQTDKYSMLDVTECIAHIGCSGSSLPSI